MHAAVVTSDTTSDGGDAGLGGSEAESGAASSSEPLNAAATHINTERVAYDGDTPLLIQMLPEMPNASEPVKNGKALLGTKEAKKK